jgi:predicted CXXCH cytochrome family protein
VTKHPPVLEGQCTACHSPHSSDNQFLLAGAGTIDVCATCHDWKGHSNHPIGTGVVDLRNPNLTLDCTSCHLSHGSEHEHLAPFDPRSGLCVDCHETFTR